MLKVSDEEDDKKKKSVYDNLADKLEWFMCDYFSCFHICVFFNCYKNNNNKSVAISQTASDIILHQSDANIHPLHE